MNALNSTPSVDIAIAGRGLVALVAALSFAKQGLRVALCAEENNSTAPSLRTFALSPVLVDWLTQLGVNDLRKHSCPVETMRLYSQGKQTTLDAYTAKCSELALLIEESVLYAAMSKTLTLYSSQIEYLPSVNNSRVENDKRVLTLANGATLATKLFVIAQADKALLLREGFIPTEATYDCTSFVAIVSAGKPHRFTAHQWFDPSGDVLAMLPMHDAQGLPMQYSLIWSRASKPENLQAELNSICSETLGELTIISDVQSYTPSFSYLQQTLGERTVVLGDAAHRVHPLAGQGLNLSLNDVKHLSETIAAREAWRDCGEARLLNRYEGKAGLRNHTFSLGIHALAMGNAAPKGLHAALNFGLNYLGKLPFQSHLQHQIVRFAQGN